MGGLQVTGGVSWEGTSAMMYRFNTGRKHWDQLIMYSNLQNCQPKSTFSLSRTIIPGMFYSDGKLADTPVHTARGPQILTTTMAAFNWPYISESTESLSIHRIKTKGANGKVCCDAGQKTRERGSWGHLAMRQTALEENLQVPDSKRANSCLDPKVVIGGGTHAPTSSSPRRDTLPGAVST